MLANNADVQIRAVVRDLGNQDSDLDGKVEWIKADIKQQRILAPVFQDANVAYFATPSSPGKLYALRSTLYAHTYPYYRAMRCYVMHTPPTCYVRAQRAISIRSCQSQFLEIYFFTFACLLLLLLLLLLLAPVRIADRAQLGKFFVDACFEHGCEHAVIMSYLGSETKKTSYHRQFAEIEEYAMGKAGCVCVRACGCF